MHCDSQYDAEYEALSNLMADEYALRQQALNDTKHLDEEMYKAMIEWNRKYGSTWLTRMVTYDAKSHYMLETP